MRTRELLEQAHAGERVAVTFRGKPVAILAPFEEPGDFPARPYEKAWPEIEEALAKSSPRYSTVEKAVAVSRRRR